MSDFPAIVETFNYYMTQQSVSMLFLLILCGPGIIARAIESFKGEAKKRNYIDPDAFELLLLVLWIAITAIVSVVVTRKPDLFANPREEGLGLIMVTTLPCSVFLVLFAVYRFKKRSKRK